MLKGAAVAVSEGVRGRFPAGRYLAAAVGAAHGLIHLMGVALLWRWGEPVGLRYDQVHPAPGSPAGLAVGAGWLLAAALFVAVAVLVLRRSHAAAGIAMVSAALSAAVLWPSSGVTAAGLMVDALVLLLAAVAVAARRSRRP